FERTAFPSSAHRDIAAAGKERHAERIGDAAHELLVSIGGRAELMVEMDEAGERQVAAALELAQEGRQCDRVRSARHRGQHPSSARDEIVLRDETADRLNHSGRAGRAGRARWWVSDWVERSDLLDLPDVPDLGDCFGAGGRTRTVDPAL